MASPRGGGDPTAWGERGACAIPLHFGDPVGEVAAVLESAAVGVAPWRALLRIEGDDRVEFLHRVTTADVRGVPSRQGTPALLLTPKGKIVGLLDLVGVEGTVLCGCDAAECDDLVGGLARYVLRSAVRIVDERETMASIRVVGPRAGELLAAFDATVAEDPSAAREVTIAGTRVWATAPAWMPGSGFELRVPTDRAGSVCDALLDAGAGTDGGTSRGVRRLGWWAMERVRLEAMVPARGAELTGAELPQEVGLERGIDFDKGCYPGQEVVARIHYRGRVNRALVRLDVDGSGVRAEASLSLDGDDVGRMTSVLDDAAGGGLGLGLVKTAAGAVGTVLTVGEDGARAVVRATVPAAGNLGGGNGDAEDPGPGE